MTSYYSIIRVSVSEYSSDSFAVGMIMADNHKVICEISYDKLKQVKTLFNKESYGLAIDLLKGVEHKLASSNSLEGLFEYKDSLIMLNRVEYLSGYANNLIRYDQPKLISVVFDQSIFDRLFSDYVYDKGHIVENTISPSRISLDRYRKNELPKVNRYANINLNIDSSVFPDLLTPIEMDFVGKNGRLVSGDSFDFESSINHLHNGLAKYISFIKVADEKYQTQGKYYILGQEPQVKESKNHKLWSQVNETSFLDFVPFSEFDQIEEYLSTNNVEPLVSS